MNRITVTLTTPIFWISCILTAFCLSGFGLAIAAILVTDPPTYYRTRFLEFSLPNAWDCDREGTETVCVPPGLEPHKAIIIFAAKYRGIDDSLQAYTQHLETPRVIAMENEVPVYSKVQYVRRAFIGGREWVDGLHIGSEVPGYNTRYLAGVTSHLGILVTFSAHVDNFEKYNTDFERSITNLVTQQTASPFD